MTTFDGWNARYCGDALALPGDALAHFRTKGSKNGVRRYQQEDGTWTPLGLRLRKAREGWGETRKERKANKDVARKERKAQRAEKKIARKEARHERMVRRKEKFGSNNLKGLTDAEVKKRIARAKLEREYKDLTRSRAVENGMKAVKYLMDAHQRKQERKLERDKMGLELTRMGVDRARIKADEVRSKELTKQEKERVKQSKERTRQAVLDRKSGLKLSRKADLKRAKKELKESSAWNKLMSVHKEKRLSRIRQEEEVNKGMAFVKSQLKGLNAIRRHNAFRKKDNRVDKPEFDTPLKKEIRDNAVSLSRLNQQTKQSEANWKRAEADANKAKSESETARQQALSAKYGYLREKEKNRNGNGGGGGKKPPKKK